MFWSPGKPVTPDVARPGRPPWGLVVWSPGAPAVVTLWKPGLPVDPVWFCRPGKPMVEAVPEDEDEKKLRLRLARRWCKSLKAGRWISDSNLGNETSIKHLVVRLKHGESKEQIPMMAHHSWSRRSRPCSQVGRHRAETQRHTLHCAGTQTGRAYSAASSLSHHRREMWSHCWGSPAHLREQEDMK